MNKKTFEYDADSLSANFYSPYTGNYLFSKDQLTFRQASDIADRLVDEVSLIVNDTINKCKKKLEDLAKDL